MNHIIKRRPYQIYYPLCRALQFERFIFYTNVKYHLNHDGSQLFYNYTRVHPIILYNISLYSPKSDNKHGVFERSNIWHF